MTSYLITGGTGSFGRAFTKRLLDTDASDRICIFSRGEHAQAQMRAELNDDPRCRWLIGCVRDRDRLRRAMQGVDVVVHAAALKRIEVGHYNPLEMVKTNINGAISVIEAAQDAGVKKVVALSTDKAHRPVSPYGASKALAESLFLAANNTVGPDGPRFAVTRYGNVWFSAGSVGPVWADLIAKGARVVPVTSPECTRFFMTLSEAVDLVLQTVETMQGGEINVPDLPAYRLGDLADAMGVRMDVRGLPAWEKLHENMDDERCSADARRMTVAELRDALKAMGFVPLARAA
jgi:UDP-N-acetylglucosamine 4,6-dehydratase